MRKTLFVLALLMFIFAFQFSTSGELALFVGAYKIDWERPEITWVLNWEKYLNALLWWWVVWTPIILLTLYGGIKEPRAECKIKSPILFIIGLLLLAPFFMIMMPGQIQFITKGGVIVEEMTNVKAEDLYFLIEFGELLERAFILLHTFCWFIGTTLIYASIEEKPVRAIEEHEKQKKIYCRHCGTENEVDAIFCKDCGKKLQD